MVMFPECAATPEENGPNFEPATTGQFLRTEERRLKESCGTLRKDLSSVTGHKGKQVPVPVPEKKEQPSQDIRQKKPVVRLQQGQKVRASDYLKNFKVKKRKEAGGGTYVAPRYDKSHPEGHTDSRYADMKSEALSKAQEKAPAGWEGTVKAMKKHKDIENPWALAHYMKGEGAISHKRKKKKEARARESGLIEIEYELDHDAPPFSETSDEDGPPIRTLNVEKPTREAGWKKGVAFSPKIINPNDQQSQSGVIIREF